MGTKEDIQAIDDVYEKGVANGDAAAVAALYTSDTLLLPANEPMVDGTSAIQAVLQAYLDAGAVSLELETTTLEEHGDLVIDVGRYTLGLQTPDGDAITDVGKYLQVFKRQADGSFLIAYDCFNSDLPA